MKYQLPDPQPFQLHLPEAQGFPFFCLFACLSMPFLFLPKRPVLKAKKGKSYGPFPSLYIHLPAIHEPGPA
jgi:hypothetical protein